MKIVCFIGSGFNYILADIVKPYNIYTYNDSPLHEEIIRLNKLWGHLDLLLSPFTRIYPTKNGEELLEFVASLQKVYNNFIGRPDNGQLSALEFSARIQQSMLKVGRQFMTFETNKGYSHVHTALPNLGKAVQNLLYTNKVEKLYLCTTNYDGLIDSLFTYYCEKESKWKYVLKDGFIKGNYNDWLFRKAEYKIAHLHGSYKYLRSTDGTIKIDKGAENYNPVMIYDDPSCKEAAIKQDSVLSSNLLELERQLKECDKVISIGNSFKTEPHLKQLLNANFNRPNTELIICSNKPQDVVSELVPHYSYPIYSQSTEYVKSEKQLIELFDKLFGRMSMVVSRTA